MNKRNYSAQTEWALIALLFLGATLTAARGSSFVLEGQDKGNSNTWSAGNLLNWQELDLVPGRVRIDGGPVSNQTFTISFPHLTGTTPGFEDLYNFMASSNVVFLSDPTLSSPTNADWSYSFTVQVTNGSTATIQFFARMAAGAHLNPGSSLQLNGDPPSLGNLQVLKPAAGPGAPDLAVRKSGPTTVSLGGVITYTLSYTNKDTSNTAFGAQLTDILTPEITVLTNTLGGNAHLAGNHIIWDLTNVAPRAAGQISFQVQVNFAAPVGSVLTNLAQILSSENDASYADNSSTWLTTVGSPSCSFANGGLGNTSQGGINFNLASAHIGDLVPVFPSLGMASNACPAINATGVVYIATGPLTNFLENVTLQSGAVISCPANVLCESGPYNILITPDLIGAPVNTPLGSVPGQAGRVRAVQNGYGTVLTGEFGEQLADFHSASIQIVTPCIQVFKTCDLPAGQSCFAPETPIRFRGYVTNCGNITLTNVTVRDARVGALQLFNPTNGVALTNNVTLATGAYAVFSNSFLPTLQETCAGGVTNVLTATGTDITTIGGPRASVTNLNTDGCAICTQPAIVVTKACPPGAVAPGAVLAFTGTVTNTGNITLTNVTIASDRLLTNGSALVASFPFLAPGEFKTFSGSYLVPANTCVGLADTLTATSSAVCGKAVTSEVQSICPVIDNQNPVVTCPSNLVLTADAGQCGRSNVAFSVTASDNCRVTNQVSSPPSGSTFPIGTTTVTSSATDAGGNTTSCSFTVTVKDTENPVLTCPSNLVVSADAGRCSRSNVTFTVTARDNCSVTNLVSSPPSGSTFPVGVTTVTNTATDASGNRSTCSFTVTVTETQAPTMTCSSNLVLAADAGRCSRDNVTFTVSATDNCGVTNLVSNPASGSTFPIGITTVTNTATDANGNTTSCSFTVTVTDTQNPVATCPSNLVLTADAGQCSRSNVAFSVSALDNCRVTNQVSSPPSGSTFPIGITTVTTTATDGAGNQGTCSFTVTVTDTENPVLTCPSNLVVSADAGRCSRSNVTFTVTAKDNCSVTNLVSSPPSGSTFPIGVTTVTNTATDASGNRSTCSFTVTVNDTEPPTITCPANRSVSTDAGQCFATGVSLGAPLATNDDCGIRTVTNNAPAQYPKGVTTVTWTAVDTSGNLRTCTQTVTVNDAEPPTIMCPTNRVVSMDAGQCFATGVSLGAPLATNDNCGILIVTNNAPAQYPKGVTTVTWTVVDTSGNVRTCPQTVTVNDTELPTITCSANRVLSTDAGRCFATGVILGAPLATNDNCGILTVTNNAPTQYAKGVTTVTWTVVDTSGNLRTCPQTVTVNDMELPTLTCSTNKTVEAGTDWTFDEPVASDNCGQPTITSSTSTNLGCGSALTATRTWRATDGSGNTTDCSQTVTAMGTTPPFVGIISPQTGARYGAPATIRVVATAISLASPISTLEFFNGANLISTVTNVQNIAGIYTNSVVVTNAAPGTYLFTVRATDSCGLRNLSEPVTVSVEGPVPPDFEVGAVLFNPVNGLWQQLIRMTNTGLATIISVQALFTNIQPAGVVIYNANGTNNNEPYIFYDQPMPTGATAIMLVQYYTTGHVAPASTVRFVVLSAPPLPPDVTTGIPVPITKARFLHRSIVDGYFLIDFNTRTNALYYVQYATDLKGGTNTVWTTSLIRVNGNGSSLRWLDYGPTATQSLPNAQPRRFYRVLEVPK